MPGALTDSKYDSAEAEDISNQYEIDDRFEVVGGCIVEVPRKEECYNEKGLNYRKGNANVQQRGAGVLSCIFRRP